MSRFWRRALAATKTYGAELGTLFRGFWRNDGALIRSSHLSLTSVFLLTGVIGLYRHGFEIIGGCPFGYWWRFASISNTTTFAYVLVFFGVPLVVLSLGRFAPDALRQGLKVAIPFLFVTFTLTPLFNTLFNYHFTNFRYMFYPSWHPAFVYAPVGSLVGFGYILWKGTRVCAALFGVRLRSAFLRMLGPFLLIYLYSYIITIAAVWGQRPPWRLYQPERFPGRSPDAPDIQLYSSTLSLVLVVFMPFVICRLDCSRGEKTALWLGYALVCIMTIVYLNNALGFWR